MRHPDWALLRRLVANMPSPHAKCHEHSTRPATVKAMHLELRGDCKLQVEAIELRPLGPHRHSKRANLSWYKDSDCD